jgi:hypothetical protein
VDDKGNQQEQADNDGEQLGRKVRQGYCQVTRVGRQGQQATRVGDRLIGSNRQMGPASNESIRALPWPPLTTTMTTC